jgi:hypothetical protein
MRQSDTHQDGLRHSDSFESFTIVGTYTIFTKCVSVCLTYTIPRISPLNDQIPPIIQPFDLLSIAGTYFAFIRQQPRKRNSPHFGAGIFSINISSFELD